MYPKGRGGAAKHESGGVKSGVPAKPVSGSEHMKTGRAGKGK